LRDGVIGFLALQEIAYGHASLVTISAIYRSIRTVQRGLSGQESAPGQGMQSLGDLIPIRKRSLRVGDDLANLRDPRIAGRLKEK